MARKRAREPEAPTHLVEPLNPHHVAGAYRNTPGHIARLLEVYRPRPPSSHRTFQKPFHNLHNISTNHMRHGSNQPQAPLSPMDTLADTALSTNPTYGQTYRRQPQDVPSSRASSQWSPTNPSSSAIPSYYNHNGRGEPPHKRARSEVILAPFQQQAESRPATSYGTQHNIVEGINNGTRKRQLSHAERDILDFMQSLQSKRHEGNADPWLKDTALPDPIAHQLALHANGDASVLTGSQESVAPLPKQDSSASHHAPDRGVTVMHARFEEEAHEQAIEDMESALKLQTKDATQTQTPPQEREATPYVAAVPIPAADAEEPRPKGKVKVSRAKTAGHRRASKTTEKQLDAHDVPQQLHSPQSLPTESSDARATDSSSTGRGTPLPSIDLPPRPHSVHGLTLREAFSPGPPLAFERSASVPPTTPMVIYAGTEHSSSVKLRSGKLRKLKQNTVCASCHFAPNALAGETESWLQCNGCKSWYHFACAGFKSEREVRDIDKFYCKQCTPKHGKTTRVRKSARAHNSVDYAKLTEGIVQTSDETVEHHYIKPIKNGDIQFTPEMFPRMPPELVTSEYFERCKALTEPVLIPAAWNPRPSFPGTSDIRREQAADANGHVSMTNAASGGDTLAGRVEDLGQDHLGMVIPVGLSVRRVAELYGLHEKLEVIDVKSQEGEDKRWTLAKWADYYEDSSDDKPVRNVISLEVSRTRLGHLIRRPQVVRDLDLADSVWMEKGHPPKVQFYILMSVADCFTDFHIDFGGSSVYYHIVKGSKTFFFIPPTTANLKHYENWCKSQAQNHCWLGNQVKECYRVDLSEGDTMLIPSGWIHAVWTPSDSLVVGGNFLTRLNYTNQIKVLEIEKNTKVPPKFRYPYFQKVMWFTVLQYLKSDPLPVYVEALLQQGGQFQRRVPLYQEYNKFGHNSDAGLENYNARYYSQAELDGLPDLVSYIFRTVMIMLGRVEGVTVEQQNAVTKSIPKDPIEHGNPLENARKFAMWVAWKRGNEQIPEWAHVEAVLPERPEVDDKTKKLSVAALKKLERAKHIEMYHTINADKLSRRSSTQHESHDASPGPSNATPATAMLNGVKIPYASPKNSVLGPKRSACDACRKRRVGCKHKEAVRDASMVNGQRQYEFVAPNARPAPLERDGSFDANSSSLIDPALEVYQNAQPIASTQPYAPASLQPHNAPNADANYVDMAPLYEYRDQWNGTPNPTAPLNTMMTPLSANASRNKACASCRKSKRKCLHDDNGNLDPIKVAESKQPRASAKKRPSDGSINSTPTAKKIKTEQSFSSAYSPDNSTIHVNGNIAPELYDLPARSPQPAAPLAPMAPIAPMLAPAPERPSSQHQTQPESKPTTVSSFRHSLLGINSEPEPTQALPLQQQLRQAAVNGYAVDNHRRTDIGPPPAFDSFSIPYEEQKGRHHLQAEPPSPIALVGQPDADEPMTDGDDVVLDPSLEAMAAQAMSAVNVSQAPPQPLHPLRAPEPPSIHDSVEARDGGEEASSAPFKREPGARRMSAISGVEGMEDSEVKLASEYQAEDIG